MGWCPRPTLSACRTSPVPTKATRCASCTCPACVSTSWTNRSTHLRSTGEWVRRSAIWDALSSAFTFATWAGSIFILTCRCPWWRGGWSVVPEVALRETFYTGSQNPDLTATSSGTPTVSHEPLNRGDFEASVDVRPPALERDFTIGNHELRHVIEPEFFYNFVGGIGVKARNVPLFDPTDIATDTNEVGYVVDAALLCTIEECPALFERGQ